MTFFGRIKQAKSVETKNDALKIKAMCGQLNGIVCKMASPQAFAPCPLGQPVLQPAGSFA